MRYAGDSGGVKLADGSVLIVDRATNSTERFIPSLNIWTNDASSPEIWVTYGSFAAEGLVPVRLPIQPLPVCLCPTSESLVPDSATSAATSLPVRGSLTRISPLPRRLRSLTGRALILGLERNSLTSSTTLISINQTPIAHRQPSAKSLIPWLPRLASSARSWARMRLPGSYSCMGRSRSRGCFDRWRSRLRDRHFLRRWSNYTENWLDLVPTGQAGLSANAIQRSVGRSGK